MFADGFTLTNTLDILIVHVRDYLRGVEGLNRLLVWTQVENYTLTITTVLTLIGCSKYYILPKNANRGSVNREKEGADWLVFFKEVAKYILLISISKPKWILFYTTTPPPSQAYYYLISTTYTVPVVGTNMVCLVPFQIMVHNITNKFVVFENC